MRDCESQCPSVHVGALGLIKPDVFVVNYMQSATSGHTHTDTEGSLLLGATESAGRLQFITVSSPSGL